MYKYVDFMSWLSITLDKIYTVYGIHEYNK